MAPRRVWRLLREPRKVTAVSTVGWLIVAGIGTAALFAPPLTIANEIGPALTIIWGVLLVTGATLGLLGCLLLPEPWWRWIEQSGIILAAGGVTIYAYVVTSLHFTASGSRLVQLGFIALGLASLALRWTLISDPTRAMRGSERGIH